jgi:hypothetical protein
MITTENDQFILAELKRWNLSWCDETSPVDVRQFEIQNRLITETKVNSMTTEQYDLVLKTCKASRHCFDNSLCETEQMTDMLDSIIKWLVNQE